ncbi:tetratricopeptide repeat protein [Chitinibacter sp. S2-10]|uniref:tetratricopeptide repeat protein n=1 Tax=Chitinibacter sp. S2-10 TaxID=3373597 RepID=UPI003977A9A5
MQLAKIYKKALGLYQLNKLSEADAALAKVPKAAANFEILQLQGAVYFGLGKIDQARVCFESCLEMKPGEYQTRLNLAVLEKTIGRLARAGEIFSDLLKDNPNNFELAAELGTIHLLNNELEQAEACFKKSLSLNPNYNPALANYSAVLAGRGQFKEAVELLLGAPDLNNPQLFLQLANVLQKAGRLVEACSIYEGLVTHQCRFKMTEADLGFYCLNYGALLIEMHRYDSARQLYEMAEGFTGAGWGVLINKAMFKFKIEHDYDGAEQVFLQVIQRYPSVPEAHSFYAIFLMDKGDVDGAVMHHRLALEKRPEDSEFLFGASCAQMAAGLLSEAWTNYEHRWIRPEVGRKLNLGIPDWQGEEGKGKSILVYREQGLGDEIMWSTCLPDLAMHFDQVVVYCAAKLQSLFQRTYPAIEFIENKDEQNLIDPAQFDFQVAMGSLPRFFRQRAELFPEQPKFLQEDASRTQYWRDKLSVLQPELLVGIVWRSTFSNTIRSTNYFSLDDLAPILQLPNLKFVNLQYQLQPEERQYLDEKYPNKVFFADELDLFDDLDASASLMKSCDLVVSAGTASLMLAGALNVPSLYLSPLPLDYWYLGHTDKSPWFPATQYLGKNQTENWENLMTRAADIVSALAREKLQS